MAPLNERQTIEEFVTLEFREFAAVWSLSGPDFYRHNHATRIVYPYRNDLAIEVELDWWEFKAFTLIVRLEEGKLPEGYLDSRGRKCRKHLATLLNERGWHRVVPWCRTKKSERVVKGIEETLREDRLLLESHFQKIVDAGETLFD